MVARAGVDADPIEHLLESLHRAAVLVEVFGAMVAAIDHAAEQETADVGGLRGDLVYMPVPDSYGLVVKPADRLLALNSSGMAQLHPYYREYRDALELRAKLAKMCDDRRTGHDSAAQEARS
jgi:hypothetical protein